MATFTDQFNIANAATLDGVGGWQVQDDGSSGAIEVFTTAAVNKTVSQEATAVQETTVPTTREQRIRANVACLANPSSGTSYVTIGCYGVQDGTAANFEWGWGLQLGWDSAGTARTLRIIRNTAGGFSGAGTSFNALITNANVTLATFNGTDLTTLQEIQLIVTQIDGGMRVRAYLNEGDLSNPTLEFLDPHDFPVNATATQVAGWYIGLGVHDVARALLVYNVYAEDYSESSIDDIQEKDQPKLSELRTAISERYSGASTMSLDDTILNRFINNAVQRCIRDLGDAATFMQPTTVITLEADANGFATLPRYVKRPISLWRANENREAPWYLAEQTVNGAVVVNLDRNDSPGSTEVRMTYVVKFENMEADTDRCPIPKEYQELIEVATCIALASKDEMTTRRATYLEEYGACLGSVKSDLQRGVRSKHFRFAPLRMGRGRRRLYPINWNTRAP